MTVDIADDHFALPGLDPSATNPRSTMPPPDEPVHRCRRGRQLHGRRSCDRRTWASCAGALQETRDRARAFPKVERIGPEAEPKKQHRWGGERCRLQTARCPPEHG